MFQALKDREVRTETWRDREREVKRDTERQRLGETQRDVERRSKTLSKEGVRQEKLGCP